MKPLHRCPTQVTGCVSVPLKPSEAPPFLLIGDVPMLTITKKSIRAALAQKPLTFEKLEEKFRSAIRQFESRHSERLSQLVKSALGKPNGLKRVELTHTEIIEGNLVEKKLQGYAVA